MMPKNVKLGIAAEFFDVQGNLGFPAPGIELLSKYPQIEHCELENDPEITAEQRGDCDLVITGGTKWNEAAVAVGSDRLIALLMTGVGYDHIDVKALTSANVMLCFAPEA